jgi:hypothetical protein
MMVNGSDGQGGRGEHFMVVLIFQPDDPKQNLYRQEVHLRVGEENNTEIVARAIETCARRIANHAATISTCKQAASS